MEMQPGGFPPGMRPARLPFPGPGQIHPGDPKQKQAMIEEFQEKIKEVSKRLGYAPGHVHEPCVSAAQGQDPSGEVPTEVKDKKPEVKPGGHKPSISSEEEKTDDTDLADFFSMFILYYYVMLFSY